MLKKLFSHSFLYAIGPQIPKLVNILILPIITKYLTPLDYGVYGTLLAYMGLLQGVKGLGFDVLLVNSFYKKQSWKLYWGKYLGGLYLYNIIFSIVYVTFLYYLVPKEAHNNLWLLIILIVLPAVLFDSVKMFGGKYFQLSQKPRYIAMATVIVGVVSIFINLYTIAYLKMGYMGWFISIAIGSFLSFCFYSVPLFFKVQIRPVFISSRKFWKKNLRVALPTIPHNYSVYLLNSSDRLVMDQLKVPIKEIGIYNLAYVFGSYLEMFGTAVGMAVGPFYAKLYAQKTKEAEQQAKDLTFFLQLTFLLLCSVLSLWIKEIFQLLINNQQLEIAYSISIIIIMGYAYRPLYWAVGSKLIFYEHTNKLWRISFVAGVLNVVLNIIFIPYYGIYAAAITTLLSLIYMGISPFYIKEFKQMNTQKYYPFLWLGSIVILTIVIYFLKDISIILKAGITIITSLLFLVYFYLNKSKLNGINV